MNSTCKLLQVNTVQQCCCIQIRFKSPKIFAANKARNFKFLKQMMSQSERTDRAADAMTDVRNKAKGTKPALLKGVPDVFQMSRGHAGVLKSRQLVLNSIYMQDISEILATQDQVEQFQDINITCVEITRDLKTLKIFWNHVGTDSAAKLTEVDGRLNRLKGYLHRNLIEKQKNANVPQLLFVFDEYEEKNRAVGELLRKVESSPGWNREHKPFDPTEFLPPSKLISNAFQKIKPRFFKKTLTTFDQRFADEQTYEFEKAQAEEFDEMVRSAEFQHPVDMRLNATGLDYKSLANRVLFYLSRSRNAMGMSTIKITTPDSWIPPAVPKNTFPNENDRVIPNTDQRIELMRRFVIEHQKKRRRESRIAMKRSMGEKELISHSLQEAEERWQSRYGEEVEEEEDVHNSGNHWDDAWEEDHNHGRDVEKDESRGH